MRRTMPSPLKEYLLKPYSHHGALTFKALAQRTRSVAAGSFRAIFAAVKRSIMPHRLRNFLTLCSVVPVFAMSSSDEEQILLLFAIQKKKKKRHCWVHPINKKRQQFGENHRLCIVLQSHEDRFFSIFPHVCFEELHDLLKPNIAKCTTNWRKPIHTRERLAICLR
ncbi:hypothetical protein NQ314_004663 [Rhamnusium bicolor]|uniref:Uncharacterized protein n=1 Tax=Rhamnusium bicolor TaxID=1586634 RepID=A0AAV8ZLD1_9CUCU|nr:hypothetical protein NQ314_004663 [Rhamnusium bicolor]